MSTQSSFVNPDFREEQGLGRMSVRPLTTDRVLPALDQPIRRNHVVQRPKQIFSPRPSPPLRRMPTPSPVIDKNPARTLTMPQLKAAGKKPLADTASTSATSVTITPAAKTTTGGSASFLDGTFTIGSLEIKKRQALAAGGAAAGGLVLWRLLF